MYQFTKLNSRGADKEKGNRTRVIYLCHKNKIQMFKLDLQTRKTNTKVLFFPYKISLLNYCALITAVNHSYGRDRVG